MPRFDECIKIAVESGALSKKLADSLTGMEEFKLSPDEAVKALSNAYRQERKTIAINAIRISQIIKSMELHPVNPQHGLASLMGFDTTGHQITQSVEKRWEYIRASYHKQIPEMIDAFRTKYAGLSQDSKAIDEFLDVLYGKKSSDKAMNKMVEDWLALVERTRVDFNNVGGSIPKNKYFRLPQMQDPVMVGNAKFEDWFKFHKDNVDLNHMEILKGRAFIGGLEGEEFATAMRNTYDAIRTEGLSKQTPLTRQHGGMSMSKRSAQHRFIYYKDAQAWKEANRLYGRDDVFGTLGQWIDTKAHETALMSIFGVSPEANFKVAMSEIERTMENPSQLMKGRLQATFNVISKKASGGELTGFAEKMSVVSNVMIAGQLGGAILSAISDFGFAAVTSVYNDVPMVKVMSRYLKNLNVSNPQGRKDAWKVMLGAEAYMSKLRATNRFGESSGVGKTAKMAEVVVRASGLAMHTEAMRAAFAMEFSIRIADEFSKPMSQLSKKRIRGFKSYGIDEKMWDSFRKSKNHIDFPEGKVANFEVEGGEAFHRMVMTETDYAVPMPDVLGRAITSGGLERNTVAGQGMRGLFMYKSFVVSVGLKHLSRMWNQDTKMAGLGYIGSVMATTAILGGVALQAKDLIYGNTPRDIDAKFIGAAIAQGGGLPLLGDFFGSNLNRYGGGFAKTLAGPWADLLDRGTELIVGNLQDVRDGKDTNFIKEISDDINIYQPKVFYTRRLQETTVNALATMIDPSNKERLRNKDKRRGKDYGSTTWWGRDESVIDLLK
jgi:hypothetical protein